MGILPMISRPTMAARGVLLPAPVDTSPAVGIVLKLPDNKFHRVFLFSGLAIAGVGGITRLFFTLAMSLFPEFVHRLPANLVRIGPTWATVVLMLGAFLLSLAVCFLFVRSKDLGERLVAGAAPVIGLWALIHGLKAFTFLLGEAKILSWSVARQIYAILQQTFVIAFVALPVVLIAVWAWHVWQMRQQSR